MIRKMTNLLKNTNAVTASEYAVMLALIILIAVVAMTSLGDKINSTFSTIAGNL